jgi:hypothetical protein
MAWIWRNLKKDVLTEEKPDGMVLNQKHTAINHYIFWCFNIV